MKKVIKTHTLRFTLLSLVVYCTACTKNPSLPAQQACPEFNEVIALAMNEDMLALYPDDFIEKYKEFIILKSDETHHKADPSVVRQITFKAAKGDWLISASGLYDSSYTEDPERMRLTAGSFYISPSCIPPSRLEEHLSQQVPQSRQSSSDRIKNAWAWDHAAPENMGVRRFITFDSYDKYILLNMGLRPNVDLSALQDQEESAEWDEGESEQYDAEETLLKQEETEQTKETGEE